MSSVLAIALSGANASALSLGAAADNIANALTPGYRRQQVAAQSVPGGGVRASVERIPDSDADLATDLVNTTAAAYSFKANLRVVSTADHMLGALLDAFA